MKTIMFLCFVVVLFSGCAIFLQVRQSDLEAWKGVPVEALDTHSLFLTVPMVKTVSESGVEIRDYVNKVGVSSCSQFGRLTYANFNSFQNCSAQMVGCDNIFYIRDGKVLEYKPVGQCYTDNTVRPEPGWDRFTRK